MKQISRAAVVWQLLAFGVVLLPHLAWLPLWLIGICLMTPGVRLMIHGGRWSLPHWSVKLVLVLAVAGGLILTYSRATGMRGMVALLIGALALKLLEIYHRRDALVMLYVSLFVLATSFLFYQTIAVALYALLATTVIVAALNSIQQDPMRADLLRPLRRALRLLLFALPLMLVLFLLFPRIGPLWSVPLDRQVARSGLADSMSPGDISQLIRSGATAFRVSFDAAAPAPAQRYWRSMIYSEFDGRTWRRARSGDEREESGLLQGQGGAIDYEIIFEPSNRNWLVALDLPAGAPDRMRLAEGHTLLSLRPVDRRLSYRARSYASYRLQPYLPQRARVRYLQLPAFGNARSRAQAARWWQQSGADPQRFVNRVLGEFNAAFSYTLTPARLGADAVDQFLFDTQQGFCGHYAGALSFLLRSVGVPARVVAGYQGGEWNPYEQYLTVRQYDAHAWTEYWVEGAGWLRVDPTAAVAPERVLESASAAYADDPAFLSDSPWSPLRLGRSGWLQGLRQQLDAANFVWHRWVLNYQARQLGVLSGWFGAVSGWKIVLALLLPSALVLGLVAWQQLRGGRRRPRDPVERALQRLLELLAREVDVRRPNESIQAYAGRLGERNPSLAAELAAVARADAAVRYAARDEQRQQLLDAIILCRRRLRRVRRRRGESRSVDE